MLAVTSACAQTGGAPAVDRRQRVHLPKPPPVEIARVDQVQAAVDAVSADRIRADVYRLAAFGTRHTLSDTVSAHRGIGAARRWVKAVFDSISAANGGRLRVSFDGFEQEPMARVRERAHLVNVVAVLPGTNAELPGGLRRAYVVGGHLDSRATDVMDATSDAPGADDDGSGVALALELARVMTPREWEADLVFIAFTGEEQGLLGSGHWAETARERGFRVEGMIADDMVGSTHGGAGLLADTYVRIFSEGVPAGDDARAIRILNAVGGENDSPSRQWARYVAEAAAKHVPWFEPRLIFRRDRFLRGGDHISFNRAGYAAVRLTEPAENYRRQHQNVRTEDGIQYGDLPGFVDYAYAARVTRVNAAALGEAALAPASPDSVVIDVSGLAYDTTLRWRMGTEPDLDGYRVVWRATTEPRWTHYEDFGRVTEATVPVSKDDVVFGVRARDREGHLSPVVFPRPGS
jgi:hypothetical protein